MLQCVLTANLISRLCRARASLIEAKLHRCYHTADGSLLGDNASKSCDPIASKHDCGNVSVPMCTEVEIRGPFAGSTSKIRSRSMDP